MTTLATFKKEIVRELDRHGLKARFQFGGKHARVYVDGRPGFVSFSISSSDVMAIKHCIADVRKKFNLPRFKSAPKGRKHIKRRIPRPACIVSEPTSPGDTRQSWQDQLRAINGC